MLSAVAYPSTAARFPLPTNGMSEYIQEKKESLNVFISPNTQNSINPLLKKVFLSFLNNSVISPSSPIQYLLL